MGSPVFCICENKAADQLRSNCEAADQRLCFRYIDNKKNYNMILSCYNYGRVTIIYDATVNY